jgi:hypothetical protein
MQSVTVSADALHVQLGPVLVLCGGVLYVLLYLLASGTDSHHGRKGVHSRDHYNFVRFFDQ